MSAGGVRVCSHFLNIPVITGDLEKYTSVLDRYLLSNSPIHKEVVFAMSQNKNEFTKENNRRKLLIVLLSIFLIVLVGISVFLASKLSETHKKYAKHQEPTVSTVVGTAKETKTQDEEEKIVITENDRPTFRNIKVPAKAPKYAKEQWDESNASEIREQVIHDVYLSAFDENGDTGIYNATQTLSSEVYGFTSDPDQQFDENGKWNPLWTAKTREDYIFFITTAQQRLMNPVFGGWTLLTQPFTLLEKTAVLDTLSDLFTNDYLSRLEDGTAQLPVYADWNGDHYGNTAPEGYFGVSNSENIEWSYNQDTQQYSAIFTSEITLSGNDAPKKKGTLTMTIVPVEDAASGTLSLKINDAKLEVK